jgi:hypothetical protein
MKIKVSTRQTKETHLAFGYIRKQADIVLTCKKCGMSQTADGPHNIPRKCVQERCLPDGKINDLAKYVTSIEGLMGELNSETATTKALTKATSLLEEAGSPFTLSIRATPRK